MNYTANQLPAISFHVKDSISALTHFIGFIAAIFAMPPLLLHAVSRNVSMSGLISLSVFMLSMILLYGASSSYHAFHLSEQTTKLLKTIDHMMIFVLIAGSYTPICIMVLSPDTGIRLLISVWIVAIIGIIFNILWISCPKWVSSVVYIGMGWLCVTAFKEITLNLPFISFVWLLIGGIIYTIGGIIYALKLPILQRYSKNFGSHELFHVFVMVGTFCHYISMMCLV